MAQNNVLEKLLLLVLQSNPELKIEIPFKGFNKINMSKNVWLYFGTSSRTLMIPASRLRGMHPDGDGTLELTFDSIVNTIFNPPIQ